MLKKNFLKKNISRIIKGGIGITIIGMGGIFLSDKEIRLHPIMIAKSAIKLNRLTICAIKLINIYKNPYYNNLTLSEKHIKAGNYLKNTFIKNGGSYIKFGQVVGCMDILMPSEYCDIMSNFFENAPQSDKKEVFKIIKQDLGKDVSEIFDSFEEIPTSSGSIAQVHKAILKSNGKEVAVKVQHYSIKENLSIDIKTVCFFLYLGKKIFKGFDYDWLGNEMKHNLPQEINFLNELKNCQKLKPTLKNSNIRVPEIYSCTERVIVMEFINGYSITNVDQLKKDKIKLSDIASSLSQVFNKMIFKLGFIHADPHPGNIFVEKLENNKYNLVLLDHGLYKELSETVRKNYAKLWTGIILKNEKLIKEGCEFLNIGDKYKFFTCMVTNETYDNILNKEKYIKKNGSGSNKKELQDFAIEYRNEITYCLGKMNPDLVLVFKVNDYINNIDRKLGKPINKYYYTAKYAFGCFERINIQKKSFFQKFHTKLLLFRTLFLIMIYEYSQNIF